jgi:hypothetical protein
MPFLGIIFSFVRGLSPQTLMMIGAGIAITVGGFYLHHRWYGEGYSVCQANALKASLAMKETYDEIAAHRPDTDALIASLRAGKY